MGHSKGARNQRGVDMMRYPHGGWFGHQQLVMLILTLLLITIIRVNSSEPLNEILAAQSALSNYNNNDIPLHSSSSANDGSRIDSTYFEQSTSAVSADTTTTTKTHLSDHNNIIIDAPPHVHDDVTSPTVDTTFTNIPTVNVNAPLTVEPDPQRDALMAFYNVLNGMFWTQSTRTSSITQSHNVMIHMIISVGE
jgi:hypothetical protein